MEFRRVLFRSVPETQVADPEQHIDGAPGTELHVTSPDPLAVVEVTSNAGEVIAVNEGSVALRDLAPGFYRARLRTAEGGLEEELVELAPGETERVQVPTTELG